MKPLATGKVSSRPWSPTPITTVCASLLMNLRPFLRGKSNFKEKRKRERKKKPKRRSFRVKS